MNSLKLQALDRTAPVPKPAAPCVALGKPLTSLCPSLICHRRATASARRTEPQGDTCTLDASRRSELCHRSHLATCPCSSCPGRVPGIFSHSKTVPGHGEPRTRVARGRGSCQLPPGTCSWGLGAQQHLPPPPGRQELISECFVKHFEAVKGPAAQSSIITNIIVLFIDGGGEEGAGDSSASSVTFQTQPCLTYVPLAPGSLGREASVNTGLVILAESVAGGAGTEGAPGGTQGRAGPGAGRTPALAPALGLSHPTPGRLLPWHNRALTSPATRWHKQPLGLSGASPAAAPGPGRKEGSAGKAGGSGAGTWAPLLRPCVAQGWAQDRQD